MECLENDSVPAEDWAGRALDLVDRGFVECLEDNPIPIGDRTERAINFVDEHFAWLFDLISDGLGWCIDGLTDVLLAIPALILVLAVAAGGYALHRSWVLFAGIVLSLMLVLNLGYWEEAIETFSLVLFAATISMILGVPIGIAAAHHSWLYTGLRPVLDLMQTIPTFVYLIPTLVLFGLGTVPGLISTVVFAIPAPIRLTHLGISSAPPSLEGGRGRLRCHAVAVALAGRTAPCPADDHGRADPMHHAVAVHGGDRRSGRCRRARAPGGSGPQYCQHRQRRRGRPVDRGPRDPA